MSTDPKLIEAVARAIRAECERFNSPVSSYVEKEARHRDEVAHSYDYADEREDAGFDYASESWAIIARTAVAAYEAAREDGVWVPSEIEALRAEIARYEAAAPLSARDTVRYLQLEQQLLDAEIMSKG